MELQMHEERTCQLYTTQNWSWVNNFLLAFNCFLEPEEDDHDLNGDCEETLDHELAMQEWVVIDHKLVEGVAIDISLKSQSNLLLRLHLFSLLFNFG